MAASAGSGSGEPVVGAGGEPRALSPEEIARRLESTRRELSNRRKILLRNLPAESSSQTFGFSCKKFFQRGLDGGEAKKKPKKKKLKKLLG